MIFTNYYNFTPAQVGLTYISPVIGSFIFSFYAAWASDWFQGETWRRNNGVSEAEHRLGFFFLMLFLRLPVLSFGVLVPRITFIGWAPSLPWA